MKKIYHWICEAEKVIAMTGIVLMTIFIFLGAVSRAVGHPFSWTTDMGVFMLAWSTFLGGDIAFREGRLANLDIVLAKFPVKAQKGDCLGGVCHHRGVPCLHDLLWRKADVFISIPHV